MTKETMAPGFVGELGKESESDIMGARRIVREAAIQFGFSQTDVTRIVTGASELARNKFKYPGGGVRRCHPLRSGDRVGLDLQFVDQRPGIPNIRRALPGGFSSSGRLGLGLPGTKRLMDEMEQSEPGKDAVVTVRNGGRNKE